MTPQELRDAIIKLLPSQIDDLVREELSPEQAAHVPPAPRRGRLEARLGRPSETAPKAAAASSRPRKSPPRRVPAARKPDANAPSPGEQGGEMLFSWIHLSDIHMGHGGAADGWDQERVLRELRKDVAKRAKNVRPQAIFVTGNVAFSGASRDPKEYERAGEWLRSLASAAGLKPKDVFLVPGNHDTQRSVDEKDKDVRRLVGLLRRGEEDLDAALADEGDCERLKRRLASYSAFAAGFAPDLKPLESPFFFWLHERSIDGGLKLRVAGLNTAIIAGDNQDRGNLRLGKRQLKDVDKDDDTLMLVLSHHPFHGGWLGDESEAASWVHNHAHLHLSGHVHEAGAEQVVSGGGNGLIRVVAGACHGDAEKGGPPPSHGYNFGALVRGPEGKVQLAVWPRRWSQGNAGFRTDVDNVPDEETRSLHEIVGVKLRRSENDSTPVPRPPVVVVPPDEPSPESDLVSEWVEATAELFQWIQIAGYRERNRFRLLLEQIFVPLRVRAGRRRVEEKLPGKLAEDYVESREVDLPEALRITAERPETVGLAVLGEPGAGKTTLLKQLFIRVARDGSSSVGLPENLRPVFLRCSQIEPGDLRPYGLADTVRREAARNQHAEAGRALAAARRPLLFLLDGLDEVRDEPARAGLCRWLGDEVARWPGSRFVVTCRFAAWRRAAVLDPRFVPVAVQMLDEKAVADYVHKWFGAVERVLDSFGDSKAVEERARAKADKLLAQLLDSKRQANFRLRSMTENPLLLSTLCLVHHSDWKLPDRRGDLYDRCISLLLEEWARERPGAPALPDKLARQVLQPLAWAMHSAEARAWPAEKVVEAIAGPLSEIPDLPQVPEEFLERARNDCGVLASKDLGSYEFFHLSFQEYLAAVHAKEKMLVPELAGHAGEPWWREVLLLAAAQPGVLSALIRAMAKSGIAQHRELLRECVAEAIQIEAEPFLEVMNQGQRDEEGGAAAVGAVLEILGSRAPRAVVERTKELMVHQDAAIATAARSLVDARASAPPAGVPILGQPFREKTTNMSFLWVPPGKFWMGSSREPGKPNYDPEADDNELPAREVTLTDGFWIGEHPVTNAQYAMFMEAAKVAPPEYWRDRRFNAPDQPLVGVNWNQARDFTAWLTQQAKLGDPPCFELPTEAEWEYAARGSKGRKYPWGDEPPDGERADFGQRFDSGKPAVIGTHPAGKSPWGAQDMAGGVWEWCLDGWHNNFANMVTEVVNPCHLPASGEPQVIRGGTWFSNPRSLRCASRHNHYPGDGDRYLGFRVVCRGSRQHIES